MTPFFGLRVLKQRRSVLNSDSVRYVCSVSWPSIALLDLSFVTFETFDITSPI